MFVLIISHRRGFFHEKGLDITERDGLEALFAALAAYLDDRVLGFNI